MNWLDCDLKFGEQRSEPIPASARSDEWYEAASREMAEAMRRIQVKCARIALGLDDGE